MHQGDAIFGFTQRSTLLVLVFTIIFNLLTGFYLTCRRYCLSENRQSVSFDPVVADAEMASIKKDIYLVRSSIPCFL